MIQASIYSRVDRHPKPGTTKAGNPMATASIALHGGEQPRHRALGARLRFGLVKCTPQHHQGDGSGLCANRQETASPPSTATVARPPKNNITV